MAARFKKSREASLVRADGVVWSRNSWATPPHLRELMWLRGFLLIAHPPLLLLRRGAWNPYPVLVCAQLPWTSFR